MRAALIDEDNKMHGPLYFGFTNIGDCLISWGPKSPTCAFNVQKLPKKKQWK